MICVDYSEAVMAFFTTREDGTPVPEAVTSGSPARQLRDACEPVAMHPVWSPAVNEHLAKLGLDFLAAYVGGRGSVLGDPAGAVVAAAFAWFEPDLVTGLWDAARPIVPPAQLATARNEATAASLSDVLAGEDVAGVADLLADAAEPADGMGRPLFSGLRSAGRPADPCPPVVGLPAGPRAPRGQPRRRGRHGRTGPGGDEHPDRAVGRHAAAVPHRHPRLGCRGHAAGR
jgi:hypothetical protein